VFVSNAVMLMLLIVCICDGKPTESSVQQRHWFTWYFCRLWK